MKRICLDISPLATIEKSGIGFYIENLIDNILEFDKVNQYLLFGFSPIQRISYLKNLYSSHKNLIRRNKIIPLPSKLSYRFYYHWQRLNFPYIENFIGDKIDVYHNFEWYMPPARNVKTIATVYDITTKKFPELHKKKNVELQNLRLSRLYKTNRIVAISETTRNDIVDYYNYPKEKIDVIYPGANPIFKPACKEDVDRILNKYSLSSSFILSVGTLEPRKNIARLIQAYISLTGSINEDLVIVGQIGWGDASELSISNSINSKIKFLNYVPTEDLAILYSSCSYFVYIPLYEGFGIPVIESMGVGKPFLASDIDSLKEVSGNFGYKANPLDVSDIANKLQIMSGSVLHNVVDQNAIERSKLFNYKDSAIKMIEVYNILD
ncbi:MAG: glycosyltransferase family 4 protein [bacterium]|nr:glycosyltransferase family 4 protein [bacterium]